MRPLESLELKNPFPQSFRQHIGFLLCLFVLSFVKVWLEELRFDMEVLFQSSPPRLISLFFISVTSRKRLD